jgi:hypothetical protein
MRSQSRKGENQEIKARASLKRTKKPVARLIMKDAEKIKKCTVLGIRREIEPVWERLI